MPDFLSLYTHPESAPMGLRADGTSISWDMFYDDAQTIAADIKAHCAILACSDIYTFTAAFVALAHIGSNIVLPPNHQQKTLQEIKSTTGAEILDDATITDILKEKNPQKTPTLISQRSTTQSSITLYTSGSSGTPTAIQKPLCAFEAEVQMFEKHWGERIKGGVFALSVAHYHAYGLPFCILWALHTGSPIALQQIGYPEELAHYAKNHHINFIAAPAFFKRYHDFFNVKSDKNEDVSYLKFVTSAGSPLPSKLARQLANFLPEAVIEIYGSTETGAVATRGGGKEIWECLNGVTVECGKNENIRISSPTIEQKEFKTLQDRIEVLDDGQFILKGRSDRVVKIFEKRISLDQLEIKCAEHEWVETVKMTVLPASERLGAAAQLTQSGEIALEQLGKRGFVGALNAHLHESFDLVVLPRKWRFVDALPVNDMGKVNDMLLLALFDGK